MKYIFHEGELIGEYPIESIQTCWYDGTDMMNDMCFDEDFMAPENFTYSDLTYVETEEEQFEKKDHSRVFLHMKNGSIHELELRKLSQEEFTECSYYYGGRRKNRSLSVSVVTAENNVSETHFTLPQSGIIYLRYSKDTPNTHRIVLDTPNGNISYDVPILRISDYTLEKILEEKLWFLLPFHFFTFELDELENDSEKLSQMIETYSNLWNTLEKLVNEGVLTEFERNSIKALCATPLNFCFAVV